MQKKFFVKENTISNYEKGVRSPSVEFLTQVCKEFGLTLDYFENKIKQESSPSNLVITTKYDKQAIFDTKQSCYLTPHIYENIYLSKYGYHLVFNKNKQGNITYSAMVDNFGNVTEYKDMILGNNGYFDKFGNIPAYSKKLDKVVLMNFEGKVLSGAYTRIQSINTIMYAQEDANYGIYLGFCVNSDNNLYLKDLIDKNGQIIPLKLTQDEKTLDYKIKEFLNIETIILSIKKYGIAMIYFIPDEMFKKEEIYLSLIGYYDLISEKHIIKFNLFKKTEHF